MKIESLLPRVFLVSLVSVLLTAVVSAQAGWVLSQQQISEGVGGFVGPIDVADSFGMALARIGDLDGDGVEDLAVGAERDDDGGLNRGAVWILFLNQDGTVKAESKISHTTGGFTGGLSNSDSFGVGVDSLGDLDGDGVVDLAVGAAWDDDGGFNRGAVWILFLNADGTVKSHQKISSTSGGFVGPLKNGDGFGYCVDTLGDVDSDGTVDLVAGSMWDDDGGNNRGALWILFLNPDGTLKAAQKISQTAGGFGGTLGDDDTIGVSVAGLGDLDGDGIPDLASGADHCDDGGNERGAVWVIFLNADGTVKAEQKISSTDGGFAGPLEDDSNFGLGVGAAGDLDADGNMDLAVGVAGPAGGGSNEGAVWILFLESDGTVRGQQLISTAHGGFTGTFRPRSYFGFAIESMGDHDGDGFLDLVVGAPYDDAGAVDQGSVWMLHLKGCPGACSSHRNPDVGGYVNADVYSVTAPPVLGATFTGSISTAGMSGSWLVGFAAPLTLSTSWGNLLVDLSDPAGELLGMPFAAGDPAVISLAVPDDPGLCGFELSTQGLRIGGGLELTNAQDLIVGR